MSAIKPEFKSLKTARDANDGLFSSIYAKLQASAASENNALYQAALSKAKTKKQRDKCAGYYCGRWQVVFNAWCESKIPNIFALEAIETGFISDNLLELAQ